MLTDDDVTWMAGVPSHTEHGKPQGADFVLHEATVLSRTTLFPDQRPTHRIVGCRLCGEPGTEFSTRGCQAPLSYCQMCLDHAYYGTVGSFDQAAVAARFLSEYEFGGAAFLENQIARIQLDATSPRSPAIVDGLLIARFAIRRRRWAGTHLLAKTGLLGDGLRMSRGTIMEAIDGHLCLSMQEKSVDDFFHQHHIAHDREPFYPYDAELNPRTRRRADWMLADGTLVEMWGLPDDPSYATKMREKQALAARHGIRLVDVTSADIRRLPVLFASWLSATDVDTSNSTPPARPVRRKTEIGDNRGGNPTNRQQRGERLDRCREAVARQAAGLNRREIAEALNVTRDTVKILLRDGKFYAAPESDPDRSDAAIAAADARERGLTKRQFLVERRMTSSKVDEAWKDAWKDADVLLPNEPDRVP